MGHGGIAILAVVFALALAAYGTASALAQIVVYVINQQGTEEFDILDFEIFGTTFVLDELVRTALALVLVTGALLAFWRLSRGSVRSCPECRSEVPRDARICRYCTTDLEVEP